MMAAERHLFTADEDREILRLRNSGMSHVQIAKTTGLNLSSIHSRISLLNCKGVRNPDDVDRAVQTKREMVRCLGGCGQMFSSPDRMRIRVCQVCKERHRDSVVRGSFDDFMLRL